MFNILNEGFERKYLYENELDPIKKEVRRVLKNEGYDVTTDDADKLITEAAEYINYTRTVGGNNKFSVSQWLQEAKAKECIGDECEKEVDEAVNRPMPKRRGGDSSNWNKIARKLGIDENVNFRPTKDYDKVTYTVCDMTTGENIGSYDTDLKAQVAAQKYAMNNKRKASAVDSNFDVIATYDHKGSEIFNKNLKRRNESFRRGLKESIDVRENMITLLNQTYKYGEGELWIVDGTDELGSIVSDWCRQNGLQFTDNIDEMIKINKTEDHNPTNVVAFVNNLDSVPIEKRYYIKPYNLKMVVATVRSLDGFDAAEKGHARIQKMWELQKFYIFDANESLKESIRKIIGRLNEAGMSPEDKRDTQLLWKVFDKYNNAEYGTTPKLTSAEKSVLKRYGVSPYYKAMPDEGFDEYTNQATLVKGQGDDIFPLTRKNAVGKDTYVTYKNRDKYNLADKARKMDVRGNRGYLGSMGVDRTNKFTFNPRLIDVERDYQNQQMQKPVNDMRKATYGLKGKYKESLMREGKDNLKINGTKKAIAEDFDERNLEKRGTSEYEANHNRHRRIDMYRKYANLTEDEEITEDNINDWALKRTACLTNTDYDIVRDEILGKRYSDYEVQ